MGGGRSSTSILCRHSLVQLASTSTSANHLISRCLAVSQTLPWLIRLEIPAKPESLLPARVCSYPL